MRILLTTLFSWFAAMKSFAQRPTHIPYDSEPTYFFESWENIVFYIIIPLVIIALYVIWRRQKKREQEEEDAQ